MTPHYPEIRVHVESQNPLTLVAAVRHALRQARVGKEEIYRFSEEAFARRRELYLPILDQTVQVFSQQEDRDDDARKDSSPRPPNCRR